MSTSIDKLLSISDKALVAHFPSELPKSHGQMERFEKELYGLLAKKNGFYAFKCALHVFPFGLRQGVMDIVSWNSMDLWRNEYGDLTKGIWFFGEDIFGNQFCVNNNKICTFDPETGDLEVIGNSIEDWAEWILTDPALGTGFPVVEMWEKENGRLEVNHRLIPRLPFAAGGDYSLQNLYSTESTKSMRIRGPIAREIHHLPDRAKFRIKIVK